MNRKIAEEIMVHLRAIDAPMNAAIEAVERISDSDERRAMRKAFALAIGQIYSQLMVPVCKDFPDLLPTD